MRRPLDKALITFVEHAYQRKSSLERGSSSTTTPVGSRILMMTGLFNNVTTSSSATNRVFFFPLGITVTPVVKMKRVVTLVDDVPIHAEGSVIALGAIPHDDRSEFVRVQRSLSAMWTTSHLHVIFMAQYFNETISETMLIALQWIIHTNKMPIYFSGP